MKAIFDTSSLLSLVRYYLPFDNGQILSEFFKSKIELHDIVILDKVFEECKYTAKGIIVDKMKYLKESINQIKTIEILPDVKFYKQLENQFIRKASKNKLAPEEFEVETRKYIDSADAKMLLYCLNNMVLDLCIVTEETHSDNDNKLFKKLPNICELLEIKTMTLPNYLSEFNGSDYKLTIQKQPY